ncbi:DEHA2G06930p [Debaryomyces hansenii CBS767]|uniref:DEHA2G06930p n=1 Tax=Debaryomyces hansenii (strain ATCC 36239 / CBS 767 / BCRC 21394 / JCM 1990 / NBRC 0083 / IGC 2968) TaxID=284592 RepID=Q6BIX2_DEBHA|nr:DEHA2G06930p [Debaryomyces hansenii CBS767]CAG90310.2 DEHA2G06930p [Debaryomyces hansenii CBS767]|eukprot:XP_461849.2 DEHA2G06930p [Debaryomyces hansenii CBS767]
MSVNSKVSREKSHSFSEVDHIRSGSLESTGNGGIWQSFKNSFKPAEQSRTLTSKDISEEEEAKLTNVERAALRSANSQLSRSLKSRHLQMIAIGSSIGTGLFVGSGGALRDGGPAGLIIAWTVISTGVFATVQGLGELSVALPVSGGFNIYATRFIEPAVGFAIGWNYFMQFFVLLPLELVAASITIKYWNSDLNSDIFVAIFWVSVVFITMLGVKGYGEAEFVFSLVKVVAIIGFIILSIVLICGGGPTHEFVGGSNWREPGPFANGFKGVCSVFVTAAFSFGGTEMIGLTAAETANPRKTLPKAIKQVFWRICLFYLLSLTMIGTLVSYKDESLIGASDVDATASPFVIAIRNGGIGGLPSVINAVILIAVLSVGNSSVYATSRSLNSLAEQGMAPKWTGYVDRAGRPLVAILITNVFGLFAFIAASDKQVEAFDWLLALSGLSSIFTWISINVAHIRFRRAMSYQGRTTAELPYVSQCGVWGSYYALLLNCLVLIAQFWIALFPLGGSPNAYDFFLSYLGLPVILMSWLGYKLWKKDWTLFIRAKNLDIDTGRINIDIDVLQQEIAEEKAQLAEKPFFVRFYKFWC